MLLHEPLLFASLGPTAYELIETPERQSARPYNVLVGHALGVFSGFVALFVTHSMSAPLVVAGGIPVSRLVAAVMAAGLTVLLTLLLRATQPAAISTSLLLSLGGLQGWLAGVWIMLAVLLMVAVGEPLRRWRHVTTGRGAEAGSPAQPIEKMQAEMQAPDQAG